MKGGYRGWIIKSIFQDEHFLVAATEGGNDFASEFPQIFKSSLCLVVRNENFSKEGAVLKVSILMTTHD